MQRRSLRSASLRLAVLATPVVLSVSTFVHGQTVFTAAPIGDWNNALNWNPNGVPTGTPTLIIGNGGVASTATVTDPNNPAVGGQITVGNLTGDNGTITVDSGGILNGSFDLRIGGNGTASGSGGNGSGTLLLNNGTVTVGGNLNVGFGASGASGLGSLIIGNNANNLLTVSGTVFAVGNNGIGTVVQNNGKVTAAGTLNVGRAGSAFYTMNGGTLSVTTALQLGGAVIGSTASPGRGTFTQSAGVVSTGSLAIAFLGSAAYTMGGGTLSVANDLYIGGSPGRAGIGTLTESGGTVTVGGNLYLNSGQTNTSSGGTFNFTNSSYFNMPNSTSLIVVGDRASGSLNIDATTAGAGTFTSAGELLVGSLVTGSGAMNARAIIGSTTSGALPTVGFATIAWGSINPAATSRLVVMNSGTLTVGHIDLTSLNDTGGGNLNQATLQHVGGTINAASISFGGGRYYSTVANETNTATLLIKQGGLGYGQAAFTTLSYTGGGTIQTSGNLVMSGPMTNAGATLNLGSIGVNTSDQTFSFVQGTTSFTGAETNSVGATINVTAGQLNYQVSGGTLLTLNVNGSTATNTTPVTMTAFGKAVIGGGTFVNATENLGTLSIGSLGTVQLVSASPGAMPAVLLHAGTLSIAGDSVPTGTLDVSANDAIIDNGNAATIHAQIISGRKVAGTWNGPGIQSSRAAGHSTVAGVGYASISDIGTTTFDGVSGLAPATVLTKYTLLGDSNLDGIVNTLDFNALATNFGAVTTSDNSSWAHGDYNYDGTVNSSDFDAIAANFGGNVAALGAALPDAAQSAVSLGTVVPEPVSFTMIAMAGVGMMQRRRRV